LAGETSEEFFPQWHFSDNLRPESQKADGQCTCILRHQIIDNPQLWLKRNHP